MWQLPGTLYDHIIFDFERDLTDCVLKFWRVPYNFLRLFADSRSGALHACIRHGNGLHCPRRVSLSSMAELNRTISSKVSLYLYRP